MMPYNAAARCPEVANGLNMSAMPSVEDVSGHPWDPEVAAGLDDPVAGLTRIIERESRRVDARRQELAEVRSALLRLGSQPPRSNGEGRVPVWEPVVADVAATLVRQLVNAAEGPVRTSVVSLKAGAGLDAEAVREARQRLASGHEQRAIYPLAGLEDPSAREWMTAWAEVGEVQRVCEEVPSDFAVFGQSAVMAVATWGDPRADYVLIREPMLVRAFIALFDRCFDDGLPVPGASAGELDDARLTRLLGTGLKDEAIARYLGVSLRTVRRRIARLMATHGAETRFQLGAAAARAGMLPQRPV
jgi:hypothetical protein